ncbi:putative AAA family ATPase/60S ribosome export protein Rix7 [Xylariaceae sp. FL0016]|nr:putative AAA family ATPase/60S ribosome export protein Rix7 [Xylariaceae sp. FL0016]
MPPRTLQGIDRDVYQIIRKFEEEREREGHGHLKFTISGVYDSIKRSNSSLARQKKRPLEDSIERVLRLRKDERAEEDEEAAIDEASQSMSPKPKERDYFLMNKHITKSWNVTRREREMSPTPQESSAADNVNAASVDRQSNGEPKRKRRKADRSPPAEVSLDDLGGIGEAIVTLYKSVARPMRAPTACRKGLLQPARGVLLYGPPGCGKTKLATAFAAELGVAYIPVSAPSLIAGMSGESEKKIRELYDEAKKLAPCLIFIDEIDAIMGKRENAQREMEKRIVAQMLTCMDSLDPTKMDGKLVVTLAATNRPDSIDPALRRAGRFNLEISLGIPNEAAREAILRRMLQKFEVSGVVDYKLLAKRTPGFVGADLQDLVRVAQNGVLDELAEEEAKESLSLDMEIDGDGDEVSRKGVRLMRALAAEPDDSVPEEKYRLTMQHLTNAIGQVQPSSKREGFTTIPDTTWDHIGALRDVRKKLMLAIVKPIQDPEEFTQLGREAPSGVLLWGPPGCGKTLLAKAVANESKANFISIKGPELLNKYVGESERSVRQVFSRARASAPCILFFDELDALVPRRDGAGTDSSARVVNQLLTEMDGMSSRVGVYIVGATNRPDMIDPAILRPGRLGTNIFVDIPDADGRVDILKTRIRRMVPTFTDFSLLEEVARDSRCEGFSGADLDNLHGAAVDAAYERRHEGRGGPTALLAEDWEVALANTKPSVSDSHSAKFQELKETGWE